VAEGRWIWCQGKGPRGADRGRGAGWLYALSPYTAVSPVIEGSGVKKRKIPDGMVLYRTRKVIDPHYPYFAIAC
jgi:hypothetical protein